MEARIRLESMTPQAKFEAALINEFKSVVIPLADGSYCPLK